MTNESTEQGVREARLIAADLIEKLAPFFSWKEPWLLSAEAMRAGHRGKVEHVFVTDAILATLSPDDIRREEVQAVAEALFFREMAPFITSGAAVVTTWAECADQYPKVANRHLAEALTAITALNAIRSQPSREGEK